MHRTLAAVALALAAVPSLAGAAQAPPPRPVATDEMAALRCVGRLIDRTPQPAVVVLVQDIDDTTTPLFNEERRLSMGGAFVLRAALVQMESRKVRVAVNDDAAGPRALTIGGAWTQDDLAARHRGVGTRIKVGEVEARLGARRGRDLVAGDFYLASGGIIRHAATIGILLPRRAGEALVVVDDGSDRFEIGYDDVRDAGAQHAQRRILQAAAIAHMAAHFEVDPAPCLAAPAREAPRPRRR
jgi:hypothetical protein